MKAMILAAGLGTRLRPWTLEHPKALVPVGGVPMLERVILGLKAQGFTYIVVNVHHFASQITEFLAAHDYGVEIAVSDESECLLDTGGALLHAAPLLCRDQEPFLVHNVDILSDAPLRALMEAHAENGAEATLLVSQRQSTRHLLFDGAWGLRAWRNNATGEMRGEPGVWPYEQAFSGIHAVSPALLERMRAEGMKGAFPIMGYYLSHAPHVRGFDAGRLRLLDIGKPETLQRARALLAH